METKSKILNPVTLGMMAVAFIGILDSGYLTASKLFGTPLKCGLSGQCEIVTQSSYSMIFGVPLSLLGMLFYLTMFFGVLIYREFKATKILQAVSVMTYAGLFTSIYLVFLQIFVIHAICRYCMISASSSLLLAVFGTVALVIMKKPKHGTSVPSPLPNATDSESL